MIATASLMTFLTVSSVLLHSGPTAVLSAIRKAEKLFTNKSEWARRSILATGSMGKFSSDNTISQYAKEIWHVEPVALDNAEEE